MAACAEVPTARHDLRAHLAEIEAKGLLVRVPRPINKDTELHPLVRWQFRGLLETQRRAFLFENVHDICGRSYALPVVVGALAGSETIYALSMGCRSEQVLDAWQRAGQSIAGDSRGRGAGAGSRPYGRHPAGTRRARRAAGAHQVNGLAVDRPTGWPMIAPATANSSTPTGAI